MDKALGLIWELGEGRAFYVVLDEPLFWGQNTKSTSGFDTFDTMQCRAMDSDNL